jgi:hypothetical protein
MFKMLRYNLGLFNYSWKEGGEGGEAGSEAGKKVHG